jgi:hypothetical protein
VNEIAVARTITSEPVPARVMHFALFDALNNPELQYAHTCVWENSSPGILDSLRVWTELHGVPIVYVRVAGTNGLICDVYRATVESGAYVEVFA